MTRPHVLFFTALALGLCASPVRAQQPVDEQTMDPPAHVAFVDGAGVLERDGQPDTAPLNMPLLAGDRLRTQAGRIEILFGDGSILHMDARTVVDFQSDELVRLLQGRVRLTIPGANRAISYRIDAPWASAQITQSGEYRLSMLSSDRGDELELAVIRGMAELVNDQGRTPLRAGERALARANAAPSYAYVYNSAAWDEFDQWSEARRDERLGVSTQYLPDDVRPYAASFDRYGSWQYRIDVRICLVSAGGGRLAAVLQRAMGDVAAVRLDVDRCRPVGLAHASLRALGIHRGRVVLDSRTHLGPRVGVVGLRAGLRELVPARLEQLRGDSDRQRLSPRLRSVARLDRRPGASLQRRVCQRPERRPFRSRCPHAHGVLARDPRAGLRRLRGAARPGADSRGRHRPSQLDVAALHQPRCARLARRERAVAHHGRACPQRRARGARPAEPRLR